MNRETLIIGVGPGGLAAAIQLASAGLKVKVIERSPVVGGRTSVISKIEFPAAWAGFILFFWRRLANFPASHGPGDRQLRFVHI